MKIHINYITSRYPVWMNKSIPELPNWRAYQGCIVVVLLIFLYFKPIGKSGEEDKYVSFVTCPIIRDSKTFPCWLVAHKGKTYYLGQQGRSGSLFYPPQLKHQVLVEGYVKEGSLLCGGIVLDPVVISVLPELDLSCNTLLPVQDGLEPPPPIPYPENKPLADDTRSFTIYFDFDSDFLSLHKTRIVSEAVRIAKLNQLKSVEISTFRATTLLSDGGKLVEKANIAELRAEKLRDIFEGLGFEKSKIRVIPTNKASKGKGENDWQMRKAVIRLY